MCSDAPPLPLVRRSAFVQAGRKGAKLELGLEPLTLREVWGEGSPPLPHSDRSARSWDGGGVIVVGVFSLPFLGLELVQADEVRERLGRMLYA